MMGTSGSGVEVEPVADLGRRDGQELLVLGEVGREEDAQEDLGEFDRLELEGSHVHPEVRAADGREEQRRDEKDACDEQQEVAVALQVAREAHRQQGHDVQQHSGGGPEGLVPRFTRVPVVPASDDDVTDPVEQRRQREDDGVGVGHQPAVGHVGDQGEAEDDTEEGSEVGWELGVLAETRDDVERDDQQRAEDEQPQFGASLGLRPEGVTRDARATGS